MGSRRDTAEVGSAYVLHTRNRWPWRSDEGALGQGQPLVRAREDLIPHHETFSNTIQPPYSYTKD
jgi:hypothetical protein